MIMDVYNKPAWAKLLSVVEKLVPAADWFSRLSLDRGPVAADCPGPGGIERSGCFVVCQSPRVAITSSSLAQSSLLLDPCFLWEKF